MATLLFESLIKAYISRLQVATLVGGTLFILYVSWKLTLFMLATFPVIIVAAMIFGRFIRRLSKEAQDQLAAASVIVEETLQSINVVKAFTNERIEIGRYGAALQKMVGTALRTARFRRATRGTGEPFPGCSRTTRRR